VGGLADEGDWPVLKRLVVAIFAAALLTGCTGAESGPTLAAQESRPGVSAAVGAAGGRVVVPGGPTVDVPAGSVSGNGRFVVRKAMPDHLAPTSPSPFLGVLGAYEFALEGARLTGPVRITFPVLVQPLPKQADADAAAVLGHFDAATRNWKIVPAQYDPDKRVITAEIYELSWWNPFTWDFAALRNAVAADYRAALAVSAPAPDCEHEAEARQSGIQLKAAESDRIRWCYGLGPDGPVLKVVNTQGYPVALSFPKAWRPSPGETGVRLPGELSALFGQSPGKVLLGGGSSVELHPSVLSPGGLVTARSDNTAFLAMALALGLDTFGLTSDGVPGVARSSSQTSAKALTEVLEDACLKQYRQRADPVAKEVDAAQIQALQAQSAGFGCLEKTWRKQYQLEGPAGDFTGVALTWLSSGIGVLLDGVTGVADGAVFAQQWTLWVTVAEPAQQLVGLG
jgi:hypothetical protein